MPTSIMIIIGTNLRRLRAAASLSQERLAKASGVSLRTIKGLESFRQKGVTIGSLDDLARTLSSALGKTVDVPDLLEPPDEDRDAVNASIDAFAASEFGRDVTPEELSALRQVRYPLGVPRGVEWFHLLQALRSRKDRP